MSQPTLPSNNYSLGGVGNNVQFGKQGPRVVADANGVEFRDVANAVLVNVKVANAVALTDAVTLAQLDYVSNTISNALSSQVGLQVPLGAFGGNASYLYTGAVTFNDNTSVTNAIESLNSILSHLVPAAPSNFPTSNFTLTSVGNSPVLANGAVPDHTGATSGYTAGNSVTRLTSNTVTTNTLTLNNQSPNGLAADLVLTLAADGSTVGTYAFSDISATGTTDNGNYSGIAISSQAAYPTGTPGFWKSFSVQINGTMGSQGINKAQMTSNEEGSSNILYWVQDNVTATPVIANTSLSLASNGVVAYSSSVPHYNSGASVTCGLSITNLAGETYYNGVPLSISGTNGVISTQTFSYSALSIATPIARQTTNAVTVAPFTVSINGTNTFSAGTLSGIATNVNGQSNGGTGTMLSSTIILVKNGTYSAFDELNIPVSGHGSAPNNNNGARVTITADASGVDTPNSAAFTSWSSSTTLPNYEAAVVAGSLSCNQTNYASGYLPVGPNFSGHDATQYATFAFQRSTIATMTLNITGTYSHCWIALPGVSDNATTSPHSINGVWWDTAVVYNGVGSPGDANNPNAGCAVSVTTGSSGSFGMTFGTQNSTYATGNNVLIRFKLTSGQSITALSIT